MIDDRTDEITEFLTEIFVEKRDTFKKMILEVNKIIKDSMKLDFQYTYDTFCNDYLEVFVSFFQRHIEVDYMDMNMVSFYTNIILGEILLKIKIKYSKNGTETGNVGNVD
jgi:hypothetical protein